ncbi:MAG: peptide-methionine (R)-S-oxide reductase, partial [Spirochaetes bacterium]|nr:peptide-methionine (R)-S-oxide reductase [Spirochaetota bacterium]
MEILVMKAILENRDTIEVGREKKIRFKFVSSSYQFPIQLSESQWKERLTPEQYYILRQRGTERAFTGALYKNS